METLESALTAFASQRSAVITAKIVELGRAASFAPFTFRKNIEFQRAWLAAVVDPAARTKCLEQLTTKLPKLDDDGNEDNTGDTCYALERRLDALAALAPDPRIAYAMLAVFELAEPVLGYTEVEEKMIALVERHADDATPAAVVGEGLPHELTQLTFPAAVSMSAAERKRWQVAPPVVRHDTSALWAAVAATPDEDEPRAVLADALQERGDPRGELIAIQLREARGEATDEAIARAAALVKEHGKEWLGALRPIVYRAEFLRGTMARVELAGAWSSAKWKQLAQDPAWGLVEEVEVGYANAKIFAMLLATPALRANLRAVEIDSTPVWEAVVASPLPRLRRLRCTRWTRGVVSKRLAEDVLPYVERTPSIVALGLPSEEVKRIPKAVAARLTELEVDGDVKHVAKLWEAWPRLKRLASVWSERLELVRVGKREYARYLPSTFFKDDGAELAKLPKSIKRLEVVGNAAFFKRAQPVIGKRFELVFRPAPSGLISNTKA
jgi:uncharacterized protein (TIGR02996 family)